MGRVGPTKRHHKMLGNAQNPKTSQEALKQLLDDHSAAFAPHAQVAQIAHRLFGISELQPFQVEAVEAVLNGHDCLVMQPTASGKSMCFVLPSLIQTGVTLVVSPLIALMMDQVAGLQARGLRADYLHGDMTFRDAGEIERKVEQGQLDLLFVSPERMQSPHFLSVLCRSDVGLIAIDEAHCVSSWGHEFRPDYRGLEPSLARLPRVPRMALTATADAQTRADICNNLALCEPVQLLRSPLRANISLSTGYRQRGYKQLLGLLEKPLPQIGRGKAIVYAPTRASVDQLYTQLGKAGLTVNRYHAGLESSERTDQQQKFNKTPDGVMLATIAFGLGVDIPDVRRVVRLGLSASLEAMLQEIGRAGRDGKPSHASVLYNERDVGWSRKQNGDSCDSLLALLTAPAAGRDNVVRSAFRLDGTTEELLEPPTVSFSDCPLRDLVETVVTAFPDGTSVTFLTDFLGGKRSATVSQRRASNHPLFGAAHRDDRLFSALPALRLRVRELVIDQRIAIDFDTGYLTPV